MLSTCCVPGAMLQWIRQLESLSLKGFHLEAELTLQLKNELLNVRVQPSRKENTTYTKHKNLSSMRAGMFVHYAHSCTSAPPIAWHIMLNGYLLKKNENKPLFPKHHSVSLQSREGLGTEKYAGVSRPGHPRATKPGNGACCPGRLWNEFKKKCHQIDSKF